MREWARHFLKEIDEYYLKPNSPPRKQFEERLILPVESPVLIPELASLYGANECFQIKLIRQTKNQMLITMPKKKISF